MNKKLMTLAVAGAFVAPAAALAQSSNVQVFGTMYMEYAYAKPGSTGGATATGLPAVGEQPNVDVLQSPGSEVGIKGEEALGGGMTAWFQCASTADIRGSIDGATAGFCSRNSAIGVKGRFGNAYVGNWDMPMKKVAGAARILSDTGIWGVGRMLFGDSSTFGNGATAAGQSTGIAFSRRQNSSLFYDTPNFSGFQGYFGISTTTHSVVQVPIQTTNGASGSKPRMWGVSGTYTNGPLYIMLGYEKHSNYSPGFGAFGGTGVYSGDDSAWQAGATYQFGPVKAGAMYVQRKYDMASGGASDLKVNAWNIAGEWNIAGPHSLRGGYTRAENTKGNAGSGIAVIPGQSNAASIVGSSAGGGLVGNGGAGQTGGSIWQIQYVYNASKRTEFTVGYVSLSNDAFARYSLGGLSVATPGAVGGPAGGNSQTAFAVSMKNTF